MLLMRETLDSVFVTLNTQHFISTFRNSMQQDVYYFAASCSVYATYMTMDQPICFCSDI